MKSTKKALFTSIMSLLVCVSMLVGTTFAWFTDSVTSGTNQIVAGNLDVELEHQDKNQTAFSTVSTTTKLFDDVDPELWEPGAVAYENLKVSNKGTLALKYQLSLNVANETKVEKNGAERGLSQALKVAVIPGGVNTTATRDQVIASVADGSWAPLASFTKTGTLDAGETSADVYGVVIYWEPTDHDNDFNMNNGITDQLKLDLGVTLVATQLEKENDSFGTDYDSGATYPVTSNEELSEALGNAVAGDSIVLMSGASVSLPTANYVVAEGVSIIGEEGSVLKVDGTNALKLENDNITISNVEISATNSGSDQYNAVVDIKGDNVTLDNVTINSDSRTSPVKIGAIDSEDNTVVIKNSTINAPFKAIHIVDGSKGKIIIDNCHIDAVYPFNVNTASNPEIVVSNSTLKGWTSYGPTTKSVTFTNCTFGIGHTYGVLMAYADTKLVNCTFEDGFDVYIKAGCVKTMTFTNCTKNGTAITAANVGTLFDDTDSDSIANNTSWTITVN